MSGDVVVVGLGNPGSEYRGTRHNLGEDVVRELARRLGADVSRKRWQALVGTARVQAGAGVEASGSETAGVGAAGVGAPGRARTVWLVLPQTYMNMSGRAVAAALRDTGCAPDSLWVVHDELDLPLCRLRIRQGGSSAGNNGIKSIIGSVHTPDFWRFRVGVGKPPPGRGVDYVLGRWSRAEAARVPAVIEGCASALELALLEGPVRAMDAYNRAGSLGCDELP